MSRLPHLARWIALVAAIVGATPAWAQEPRPAQIAARSFFGDNGVEFTYAWRYHPGDDLDWAKPNFDDSAWGTANPRLPVGDLPRDWAGAGWFRRHLVVGSDLLRDSLAIRLTAAGAAEVYLDGRLIGHAGQFAPGTPPQTPPAVYGPWPVVFSARPDHVIAVRYACAARPGSAAVSPGLGFTLALLEAGPAAEARAAVMRRTLELLGPLAIILVFVTLLHLALFSFYPKLRENLFYAINMAVLALIVFRDFESAKTPAPSWADLLNRLTAPAPLAAVLFGLLTYYAVRTRPFPSTWKAFVAAAIVLAPASYLTREPYPTLMWTALLAAMIVEIVRVEVTGRNTVPREGAPVLLVGLALLAFFVFLQVLINFNIVPPVAGLRVVYTLGVLASVVTMSLFLAGTFARTSLHLERRLAEVQALSAEVLEQERAAHAAELRARLLETENARKSAELEAARAMQLSMLPTTLPEASGLQVAVAMSTATEVGGDYYDFRADGGKLVVALGDATGHGVAAGTMVTAVKALFATLSGQPRLERILGECDRVLRDMNVKPLHMCLVLGRFSPEGVTICSAGMPPVLVWRAASGAIEEAAAGGLPLGSHLSPSYVERAESLAAGDTLLFATDGFSEQLDQEGRPLGFDGAERAFAAACGGTAQQVVDRLTETVTAWRGAREQTDDVTFVVVRVAT
jgi:serine phosphatase RsbU (regulator of sigma subunit)